MAKAPTPRAAPLQQRFTDEAYAHVLNLTKGYINDCFCPFRTAWVLFASVAFNLGAHFVKKNAASLKFIVDQDLRLESWFLQHDVASHVYNQHPLLRFDPTAVTFADLVPGLRFGLAAFSQCCIDRLISSEAKQPGRTPGGQPP